MVLVETTGIVYCPILDIIHIDIRAASTEQTGN